MTVIAGTTRKRFRYSHQIPEEFPKEEGWSKCIDLLAEMICAVQQDQPTLV